MERKPHRKLTSIDLETGECKFQNPTILTNDPSFTAWGWVVISEEGKIIDCGCIKTAPEHKKKRIRKGDDTIRRVSDINNQLINLIKRYNVSIIFSELPHGSQNASAAVMIGVVTGIVQTISDCLNVAAEWFSEQDAKKAVLGRKAATKDDMIQAVDKLYKVPWKKVKYADEAIADAMAVYHVASQQSQILKYMKR